MAVRTTLQNTINHVRTLIGDTDYKLTDLQLQSFIDANIVSLALSELLPNETITAGVTNWYTWNDRDGLAWEENAVIMANDYTVLTPTAANYINGIFTFADTQSLVYIQGPRLDLYGAAADAMGPLLAIYAREFDFATKGKQFSRSQTFNALAALREEYQGKRFGLLVAMGTNDVKF
jgi:hypothetical protein